MNPQQTNIKPQQQAQGYYASLQNRPRSAPPSSFPNQTVLSATSAQPFNSSRQSNVPPNLNYAKVTNSTNQGIVQSHNFSNQPISSPSINQNNMQNHSTVTQPGIIGRGNNFGSSVHKQTQVIIGNQKNNAPQAFKPMSVTSPFNSQNVPPRNGLNNNSFAYPPNNNNVASNFTSNQDQISVNSPIQQQVPQINRSPPPITAPVVKNTSNINTPVNNVAVQTPPTARQAVQYPPTKQTSPTFVNQTSNSMNSIPQQNNIPSPKNAVASNIPINTSKPLPQKVIVPVNENTAIAPNIDIDESSSQYDEPGDEEFWNNVDLPSELNKSVDKNKSANPNIPITVQSNVTIPPATQTSVTQSQGVEVVAAEKKLRDLTLQNEDLSNTVHRILEEHKKKELECASLRAKISKLEDENSRLNQQIAHLNLNLKKPKISSTINADEAYVANLVKENEALKSKLVFQEQENKRMQDEITIAMDKTLAAKTETKHFNNKMNQSSESSLNANSSGFEENSEKQRPAKKQKTTAETTINNQVNNNVVSTTSIPSLNLLDMLPSLNFEKQPQVIQQLVRNSDTGIFILLRSTTNDLTSQLPNFIFFGEASPSILFPVLQLFVNKEFEHPVIESALDVISTLIESSEECRKRLFACSCTHCSSSPKTSQSPLQNSLTSSSGISSRVFFNSDANSNVGPIKLTTSSVLVASANPEEQNALLDYLLNIIYEFFDAESLISKFLTIFLRIASQEPEYHMERFEPLFTLRVIDKLIILKLSLSTIEQVADLLNLILRSMFHLNCEIYNEDERMLKLSVQKHEKDNAVINQIGKFLDYSHKTLKYSDMRPLRKCIVKLLQNVASSHTEETKALACIEDVSMRVTYFLRDELNFIQECEAKDPSFSPDYTLIREGMELLITIFSQSPEPLLYRQPFINVITRLENQGIPKDIRNLASTASFLENEQYDASQHPSVMNK